MLLWEREPTQEPVLAELYIHAHEQIHSFSNLLKVIASEQKSEIRKETQALREQNGKLALEIRHLRASIEDPLTARSGEVAALGEETLGSDLMPKVAHGKMPYQTPPRAHTRLAGMDDVNLMTVPSTMKPQPRPLIRQTAVVDNEPPTVTVVRVSNESHHDISGTESTVKGESWRKSNFTLHEIWTRRRSPDSESCSSRATTRSGRATLCSVHSALPTNRGTVSKARQSVKTFVSMLSTFKGPRQTAHKHQLVRAIKNARESRWATVGTREADHGTFIERLSKRIVMAPTSATRFFWDLFGMLLVLYDIINIPLQWMAPPDLFVFTFLNWVTTLYWTIDIAASFCVGYHASNGLVEMSLIKIAWRYVKSWLLFDLIVVGVDWGATILNLAEKSSQESSGNEVGFLRIGRTARFMRMLRLLRLLKVQGTAAELFDRIQSEAFRIILCIVGMIVFIVLANHVVACGFYGISIMETNRFHSWVLYFDLEAEDRTFGYKYTTALHWSLTQFTPASMEITPRSTAERTYTTFVIFIALLTFSSFISSLTNAITQLRNLNVEQLNRDSHLRRYLRQNSISTSLTARIWAWLQVNGRFMKRRLHERDVEILQLLPTNLLSELQEQVYAPQIVAHPFFFQFSVAYESSLKRLYYCLEETSLGIGKELFNANEVADRMFFFVSGKCNYLPQDRNHIAEEVAARIWCVEPVLWIQWRTRGGLVALEHTEVFGLRDSRFHELLGELTEVWEAHVYARMFAEGMNTGSLKLSDLTSDFDVLQDLAQDAFSSMPEQSGLDRTSARRSTNYEREESEKFSTRN